jgi:hypothetical protein
MLANTIRTVRSYVLFSMYVLYETHAGLKVRNFNSTVLCVLGLFLLSS